jgi:uncharacterized protein YcbX
MTSSAQPVLGSVVALWRYPVKSMMGEELNAAEVTERGLRGDRTYALVDRTDGKVASAKNPRKWPRLFDYRAALADAPPLAGQPPAVRITLPDGTTASSEQPDVHQILSRALARDVTLRAAERRGGQEAAESAPPGPEPGTAEEYWPDIDGLEHRDTVTEFSLPEGTFFDAAAVHVLTTATLDRLRELYPHGRFEARRFRPNIIVEIADGAQSFPENAWIGHTLVIGETIRLGVSGPCPRCVMTTLAQDDLPKDAGILRTAAQHNQANVGVYASVLRGGTVRRGDAVRLA